MPDDYWEPLWPGKQMGTDWPEPIDAMVRTTEVWVNDKCQVLVYDYPPRDHTRQGKGLPEGVTHKQMVEELGLQNWPQIVELSLKLNTREPWQDWRDFYRIKSELCGTACWGMQMYPPQAELLDTANQYHMYVMDPSCVGWPVRQLQMPVTDYSEKWKEVMAHGEENFGKNWERLKNGAKQRPWQEHHKCDDLPLIGPVWAERGWYVDDDGEICCKGRKGEGRHGTGKRPTDKT